MVRDGYKANTLMNSRGGVCACSGTSAVILWFFPLFGAQCCWRRVAMGCNQWTCGAAFLHISGLLVAIGPSTSDMQMDTESSGVPLVAACTRYVANPPPSEWSMTPKDIVGGGVCGTGTQRKNSDGGYRVPKWHCL